MQQFRNSVLGHKLSRALALTILLINFLQVIQCQPQKYFKGNGITPFPSKALPRIGRRGGGEVLHPEIEEPEQHYGVVVQSEDGGGTLQSSNVPPFGFRRTSPVSRFAKAETTPPAPSIAKEKLLLVIKYLVKHGIIRAEDSTLYLGFKGKGK